MEMKKTPEADLERQRGTWLLVGFVVALSVLFAAFEWSERPEAPDAGDWLPELVFEEEVEGPVIERPLPAPPVPPSPAPAVRKEEVEVADDDAEADEDAVPETSEQTGDAQPAVPVSVAPPTDGTEADAAFAVVDELPEFPTDGLAGLMRYLTAHLRYPQAAWSRHIGGTVLCQFVVEADGRIADVQVLQGVHPLLDNEALRVLAGMPRWKPGKRKGQPVRVLYTLPVAFCLQ